MYFVASIFVHENRIRSLIHEGCTKDAHDAASKLLGDAIYLQVDRPVAEATAYLYMAEIELQCAPTASTDPGETNATTASRYLQPALDAVARVLMTVSYDKIRLRLIGKWFRLFNLAQKCRKSMVKRAVGPEDLSKELDRLSIGPQDDAGVEQYITDLSEVVNRMGIEETANQGHGFTSEEFDRLLLLAMKAAKIE